MSVSLLDLVERQLKPLGLKHTSFGLSTGCGSEKLESGLVTAEVLGYC